jgi:hypothetical protein
MIGLKHTGTLSTNHMRAFRPSFSKAETGFQHQPSITKIEETSHSGEHAARQSFSHRSLVVVSFETPNTVQFSCASAAGRHAHRVRGRGGANESQDEAGNTFYEKNRAKELVHMCTRITQPCRRGPLLEVWDPGTAPSSSPPTSTVVIHHHTLAAASAPIIPH